MNSPLPHVDILLLNFNGWRDTIECLESIFRQDYPTYRVIVCDNGSTDDSWTQLVRWAKGVNDRPPSGRHPLRDLSWPPVDKPIRQVAYDRKRAESGGTHNEGAAQLILIQTGENRGFSGGNNVGLRYVLARDRADLVLLLNNDTVIGREALRAMVQLAESYDRLGAVGATMLDYHTPNLVQEAGGGRVARWNGMVRMSHAGAQRDQVLRSAQLDYVSGGCLLTRLSTLRSVGLLDERYFIYGEDIDLCLRMRKAGFRIGHAPRAVVWHKGGGTAIHGGPFSDYHNVRSSLLFVHKHYPYLLPAATAYSVYRCVLPKLVRRQWPRLAAVGRGYRDLIREAVRS
jgi:GT2 family glycosyltransferase